MILPSIPRPGDARGGAGLLLGVAKMMGLLVGGLTTGSAWPCSWPTRAALGQRQVHQAGAHGGKGTEAHQAAVVGDTVGDPFRTPTVPA